MSGVSAGIVFLKYLRAVGIESVYYVDRKEIRGEILSGDRGHSIRFGCNEVEIDSLLFSVRYNDVYIVLALFDVIVL